MGFIRRHAGFCGAEKLKLPSLVISRPVRFVCVQNTSSSGRPTWEAWAPQLECLGVRRAPRNFYSGDQLWGLAALTKMLASPKGSLKFSLEHSLGYGSPLMQSWFWQRKRITWNTLQYVYWYTGYLLWGLIYWKCYCSLYDNWGAKERQSVYWNKQKLTKFTLQAYT